MADGQDRFDDERLARLLGARRITPEAATLERALARVRARTHDPAWLEWLARPAALAAAAALLVVCVGAGVWYGGASTRPATTAGTSSDMLTSLLSDETTTDATPGGAADSGEVR